MRNFFLPVNKMYYYNEQGQKVPMQENYTHQRVQQQNHAPMRLRGGIRENYQLSEGAKKGLMIGGIVTAVILLGLLIYMMKKKKSGVSTNFRRRARYGFSFY